MTGQDAASTSATPGRYDVCIHCGGTGCDTPAETHADDCPQSIEVWAFTPGVDDPTMKCRGCQGGYAAGDPYTRAALREAVVTSIGVLSPGPGTAMLLCLGCAATWAQEAAA